MKTEVNQKKVTLVIRFQVKNRVVRQKATYGKSKRVIPGLVIINGKEVRLENVAYEVRYYVKGQPKYVPAGRNASDAEELRARIASQSTAQSLADAAGIKTEIELSRLTIKQATAEFLKSLLGLGSDQLNCYKFVISLFLE